MTTAGTWRRFGAWWAGRALAALLILGPGAAHVLAQPFEGEGRGMRQARDVVQIGGETRIQAGERAKDVVVIRGTAIIDGTVEGDVTVVLGRVLIRGEVAGDVVVVLGDAEIEGGVGRNMDLVFSHSRFGPESRVGGEVQAVGEAPDIAPGASIRRGPEVVSVGPFMQYVDAAKEYILQGVLFLRPFPPRLGWVWGMAILFFLFHLLVALLFPRAIQGCVTTLRDQPARAFLVGLLACILTGPISVLLSFTIIATPLIWLVFMAVCVVGRVAVYAAAGAGAVGRLRAGREIHPAVALALGTIPFYLAYMVPVVGYLVFWLVLPWGVGAAVIRLFEALSRERRSPTGFTPLGRPVPSAAGYGNFAVASSLVSGAPGPATHAISSSAPTGQAPSAAEDGPAAPPPPPGATSTAPPPPPPPSAPPLPPLPPPPPPIFPLAGGDLLVLPRVAFLPRFAAGVIDLIVVGFINAITWGDFSSFWILAGVYHGLMWGWKGTTLGGAVLGLRLVRLDGRDVDWQTSMVRVLGSLVSLLPLGLGFFWVAWDSEFQSWHDRIAGTTIVKGDARMAALV